MGVYLQVPAGGIEMVHPDALRQALEAGVWSLLTASERAAMRLSCKDARDIADSLLDSVVLCASAGEWKDSAADKAAADADAEAAAAFHKRLPLLTHLRVYWQQVPGQESPLKRLWDDYAAATGTGLRVTHCHIVIGPIEAVHAVAIRAMFAALPHLQELHLHCFGHPDVTTVLLALQRCPRLHTLTVIGQDRDYEWSCVTPRMARALLALPSLRSLQGPWVLHVKEWERLAKHPKLSYLGMLEYGNDLKGPCLQLHTLAGLPADGQFGAPLTGRPEEASAYIYMSHLEACPNLQRLERCALLLFPGMTSREEFERVPAQLHRFRDCASHWRLALCSEEDGTRELVSWLPPGSWSPVRHLEFTEDDCHLQPRANKRAAMASFAAAAPNMHTFQLHLPWTAEALLHALVPSLRSCKQLHTLWLSWLNFKTMPAVVFLRELAEGLVRAGPDKQGCTALQQLMLLNADPATVAECNRHIEKQGFCVRVGSFTRHI